MGPEDSSRLQAEVDELRARVRRLEHALERRGIVLETEAATARAALPAPESTASPEAEAMAASWTGAEPAAAVSEPPRFATIQIAESTGRTESLERRIGSQWFNRVGILAVLVGVAWFLKFAFDNHWIGPLGRVLIGLVAGAGLIAWSERFRRNGFVRFSYSLKAVGTGVLYLSLWAAFSVYHLAGTTTVFAAMIVVTAFNGFLAWVQDAELLALYAIVGGFATPLLLSTGENHEVALFSYLLLLAAAVLALSALKPWSRLLSSAFLGTILFFVAWWVQFYSPDEFGTTAFFLACFFLIFALAPRLVARQEMESDSVSGWDHLALAIVPLLNAGLGFLGFYLLLESVNNGAAQPWVAVAFAAFYLVLLRLPPRGVLRGSPATLSGLHLTISVVFLTLAIPLKAHGRWLTIGWLAEGGALMWLAARSASQLLRVLAMLCLLMGIAALVAVNPPASTTPFLNERFGTYLFGIAVCALVAWLAAKAKETAEESWAPPWPVLAAIAVLAVNVLILTAVSWEIHSYWWNVSYGGEWRLMRDTGMYAQFTYSAFFMVFGAALLGVGFWRQSAFLRWQALVLLAVAVGKVFTVDVSALSQGYRIVSFLGLGALLLAVSFVYQRDWLNLRKADAKTP